MQAQAGVPGVAFLVALAASNFSAILFYIILGANRDKGMIRKKSLSLFGLKAILGCLLALASNTSLAFTIIEIPDADSAPSSSITEATTFGSQIQPVVSALRSRIRDAARRKNTETQSVQQGQALAFNSYAQTMSDAELTVVSYNTASDGGGSSSLWLNSSFGSFDNDFSRTKYDGDMQMLIVGYDTIVDDRYIFGIAVSYESFDIDTDFNSGNQEMDGYSISPYFSYLISDAWSIDLSLGIGDFDVDQFRIVGALDPGPPPGFGTDRVNSDFSSSRQFLASNLTYGGLQGNWYLSGWLGLMVAQKEQDGYTESDDTEIDSEDLDIERWSLGGEAAYGYADAEAYVGLIFEKDNDVDEVEFLTGEQPEYDDESFLLSLGWRYYGKRLIANIELSSRLEADEVSENTFSSTLRIEL